MTQILSKKYLNGNSDIVGALATTLCLLHCVATPFLFIAHTSMHEHEHHRNAPFWWQSIDILFIVVSFLAVQWSVKYSSKAWIKPAFWMSWALISFVIFNEKLEFIHLPESIIYFPALALVGLHLYNRTYCQCTGEECCSKLRTYKKNE